MGLSELLALQASLNRVDSSKLDTLLNQSRTNEPVSFDTETESKPIITVPLEIATAILNGAEIVVKKKNIILDASMFTAYQACGRFYDFTHNMQLIKVSGKGNSLEAGSIVHKILEVYYINIINGFSRVLSIASGMAAGEEYYYGCKTCKLSLSSELVKCDKHKDPNEYQGCKNVPLDSDKYNVGYNWIVETMGQYFDFYMNDNWTPLESEIVKGKIIYEDDEIRIMWKAKIDVTLYPGQPIATSMDHKTMKVNRDMLTLNNQFTGHCVIMGTQNVIINKIGFQKSLEPKEKFIREMKSYSLDRIAEWQNVIVPSVVYRFLQSNELNDWQPDYTHCETKYGPCDFHRVCEADRSEREKVLKTYFMIGPKWDPSND